MNVEKLIPAFLHPWLARVGVDFKPGRQPGRGEVLFASLVAVVGSLAADYALVLAGKAMFPSVKNYQHFQFSDYAKLTVVGVIIACIGWPIVTQISSRARQVFRLAAVLVTVVLLLPDVAIWYLGQPALGVFVLVWMHLAIAVVTYYSLVTLAPVRRVRGVR